MRVRRATLLVGGARAFARLLLAPFQIFPQRRLQPRLASLIRHDFTRCPTDCLVVFATLRRSKPE